MSTPTIKPTYTLRLLGKDPRLLLPNGEVVPVPTGKPLAALALILLEPHGVTREDLLSLLWPRLPPPRARAALRQTLYLLRRSLEGCELQESGGAFTLPSGSIEVDLRVLEQRIAEGDFAAAVASWGGGPFAGFRLVDAPGFNAWADRIRERIERILLAALTREFESQRNHGQLEAGLPYLEWALVIRPTDAHLHQELVASLLDLGRPEVARVALNRMVTNLDEYPTDLINHLEDRLQLLSARRVPEQSPSPLPALPFVGRAWELATLRDLWSRAVAGEPSTVLLLGEAGVGKTRLASELITSWVGPEAIKAWAATAPDESPVELGGVSQVVRSLSRRRGAAGVSPASQAILEGVAPSIALANPPSQSTLPPDAAIADALIDLIEAVADEAPAVIVLDDLHCMDSRSRSILLWVARRLRGSAVLVLLIARRDEPGVPLDAALGRGGQQDFVTVIQLAPLSAQACHAGLSLLLNVDSASDIEALSVQLYDVSGGNPRYLEGSIRYLADIGVIRCVDDHLILAAGGLSQVHPLLSSALSELLRRRIAELPDPLSRVVQALASQEVPISEELLGARMPDLSTVQPHLARLDSLGLLQREADGCVTLANEAIRQTARALAGSEPRSQRHSHRFWASAVLVVLALAAGAQLLLSWLSSDARLFGGGWLVTDAGHELLWFRSPHSTHAEWELERQTPLTGAGQRTGRVIVRRDGTVFLHALAKDGRLRARRLGATGQLESVMEYPGDVNVLDVAPDGDRLLLSLGDDSGGTWRQILVHYSPTDGRLSTLRAMNQGGATWLADGSGIVVFTHAVPDSVRLLAPDGTLLWGVGSGEATISQAVACGPGQRILVVQGRPGSSPMLLMYEQGRSVLLREPRLPPIGNVVCSPDGEYAAYQGMVDGVRRTVVQRLFTGDTVLSSVGGGALVAWVPEDAPAVPVEVQLAEENAVLSAGQLLVPDVRLTMSDGSQGPDSLTQWHSEDPLVASVTDRGIIRGVSEGTTRIVASVSGWLFDTLSVTVRHVETRPEPLFSDHFRGIDTLNWYILGEPEPIAVKASDEWVVDLRGDGVGNDGLLSRTGFFLPRGATIEVEYHLLLNRRDRQQFAICLSHFSENKSLGGSASPVPEQYACFTQPIGELEAFDSTSFSLFGNYPVGRLTAPNLFPASDWRHIALVVAPDGMVRLMVDRTELARLPLLNAMDPTTRWHIEIVRRAADTELLIRNLFLWDGMRY